MAESTLSVDYFRILRELARQIGTGKVYHAGTVAIASGVVTLTSGVFPSWAASGAININGTPYDVNTRNSNTQVTLTDTSVSVGSGANYTLLQTTEDDTEAVFQDFTDWIDAGYHEFLYPDVVGENPITWSFLRKQADVTTAADDSAYDLPDDFGQHINSLTLVSSDEDDISRLEIISRSEMREKQNAESSETGAPEYAAWQPKAFDAATGERFELVLYPTPDAVYTVNVEYRVQPDRLTPAAPYPRGGMLHSDTILKACRAVAERDQDDESGIHNARFMARLKASLMLDAAGAAELNNAPIL